MTALLLTAYGLLFVAVGAYVSLHRATAQTNSDRSASSPIEKAQFVGSAACAECHQREHGEWQGSQHAAAMQEANDKTVLGQFDGATFSHGGVTSTFYRKDDKFWVTTDGPDGKLADFEVRYTFGISPLQQ
ncbi:MAG TPA: multiheme c-type cytochrome, partial [Chthoniobacter sp.]|nr:multiheme c-type cytochrome [Chthoniobacter sp.]